MAGLPIATNNPLISGLFAETSAGTQIVVAIDRITPVDVELAVVPVHVRNLAGALIARPPFCPIPSVAPKTQFLLKGVI